MVNDKAKYPLIFIYLRKI